MAIFIKNNDGIARMRESNKIVAKALAIVEKHIKIGITTKELDKIVEDAIRSQGAIPSFKGYNGFPAAACISVNDEVIHGIPSKRKLLDGDIVSIDVGAYKNGYHGDAARTFLVGNVREEHKKLVKETENSFFYAIEYATAEYHVNQMSGRVEEYVKQFGYGVVREYCGHGIGENLHESPEISNYIQKAKGAKLAAGMSLAIEPMINLKSPDIILLDDDWTVVTEDCQYSAHYENTILITDGKPEILTLY
ncbi:MAG: type I methionyl aminopeptidase [Lachnospirales bacterium]